MKALYLMDSLNRGGAEMLCLDVARNAARHGIDVTFAVSGGGDLEHEFATSGVEWFRFDRRLPIDPILVSKLRQVLRETGAQVAHAQQAVEAVHLYLATRGTGVKCVMSLQNYILDRKNRIATKWIVPRMDAVCPVSRSMLDWFRDGEGFEITDRFHVLPNGVDRARLAPIRDAGQPTLRQELGIDPSQTLIGMIGNFYPDKRKDQLTICRALPDVFSVHPDAHFVFVGSVHPGAESYLDECKQISSRAGIADRVFFLGKRRDIPDILSELDLFVFSSVQEGLPVAAVEALLMGVPMLVSDIPPLMEVTGNLPGSMAYAETFKTSDADDLADKLNELLSDKMRMKKFGDDAAEHAPRSYSIDAHLRRLREIYEAII